MCYIYPAVFYKEADGRYSVIFPDLNDLATYGNDFADAFTRPRRHVDSISSMIEGRQCSSGGLLH